MFNALEFIVMSSVIIFEFLIELFNQLIDIVLTIITMITLFATILGVCWVIVTAVKLFLFGVV